ncbi:glycosyltransferase [bacterium]|nr:glycosyltransferase [bacterium]
MGIGIKMSLTGIKVVHTIPSIEQKAAGPSYSVVRLCEMQNLSGIAATLCSVGSKHEISDVPFSKLFSLGLGPKRLAPSPEMRGWLFNAAYQRKVDLFHNHSLWMMPNVYPGMVAKETKVPLITSPRGTLSPWAMQSGSPVKKLFWPLVQRRSIQQTTCFHATSTAEYEDIRRLGFQQPIAVIPNGIDIPELPSKVLREDRVLLFLGRIHPIKGLDILLPAWKVLQDQYPDWKLKIIGPDHRGYLRTVKKLASKLGLKRTDFCAPVYGDAKTKAFSEADLFVLPSYSENFGVSIAESLALGTPALVTKGAPWEGLIKKNAGFWVESDYDNLLEGLRHAMSHDREYLKQIGINGRKWMESEYSWTQINEKMIKTYQWIINGGKAPSWVILD